MVVHGACIVKDGLGLHADAEELASLGFKLRNAGSLSPDILVTVMGRPHAFMVLNAMDLDCERASISARLASLQQGFRSVYMLMPGSYGHPSTATLAARHPDVTVVTFDNVQDAVGTAARLVAALCDEAGEGSLGPADTQSQRLAVAVDATAVSTTVQAVEALNTERDVDSEMTPASSSVKPGH